MTYYNISTFLYQAKTKFLSWVRTFNPDIYLTLSRKYYTETNLWHEDIADFLTSKLPKLMDSHSHCFEEKVWATNDIQFKLERACVYTCLFNSIIDKWRAYKTMMKAIERLSNQRILGPTKKSVANSEEQSNTINLTDNKEEELMSRKLILKEIIDNATEDELFILETLADIARVTRKEMITLPSGKTYGYDGFRARRDKVVKEIKAKLNNDIY